MPSAGSRSSAISARGTPLAAVFELFRIHDLFLEMNRSDVVFIAAINGPATGGGCEISIACDIRLMADTDIAIGLPEMTIDFNPGAGGTQRLPRLVGIGRAMQMMLEGRTLSAREALDVGLVQAVVPPDQVKEAGDPDRRAPGAALAASDPIAEAGRLRGRVAAVGTRSRDRAEVVHGLLSRRSSQEKMAAMTSQVEADGARRGPRGGPPSLAGGDGRRAEP